MVVRRALQPVTLTVGVLALQGAFNEHLQLLRAAGATFAQHPDLRSWRFVFSEVRTAGELEVCDALIIPGGESTTMSLVAQRSGLLEPLRDFVKVQRRPTWGTCAGLILLAESAERTKKGGQELVGGLDVRVDRNHFGRQMESFEADLDLPFLAECSSPSHLPLRPFRAIFIRAPIVQRVLPYVHGEQREEAQRENTVVAPSRVSPNMAPAEVQIMATLPPQPNRSQRSSRAPQGPGADAGDIVAVQQANCFGTSFHPELTNDERIHAWWLMQIIKLRDEKTSQS